MAVGPLATPIAIAETAADAGNHADGDLGIDQNRSLLDMGFDMGDDFGFVDQAFAAPDTVRVEALFSDMVGERAARVTALQCIQQVGIQNTQRHAAADVAEGEPAAFFGPGDNHA